MAQIFLPFKNSGWEWEGGRGWVCEALALGFAFPTSQGGHKMSHGNFVPEDKFYFCFRIRIYILNLNWPKQKCACMCYYRWQIGYLHARLQIFYWGPKFGLGDGGEGGQQIWLEFEVSKKNCKKIF